MVLLITLLFLLSGFSSGPERLIWCSSPFQFYLLLPPMHLPFLETCLPFVCDSLRCLLNLKFSFPTLRDNSFYFLSPPPPMPFEYPSKLVPILYSLCLYPTVFFDDVRTVVWSLSFCFTPVHARRCWSPSTCSPKR